MYFSSVGQKSRFPFGHSVFSLINARTARFIAANLIAVAVLSLWTQPFHGLATTKYFFSKQMLLHFFFLCLLTLNHLHQHNQISTATSNASRWTTVSEMTKTTEGSLDSNQAPTMKRHYREHRRGFAINRRKWGPKNNQVGQKVPDAGYPADRQFRTSTGSAYVAHMGMSDHAYDVTHKKSM